MKLQLTRVTVNKQGSQQRTAEAIDAEILLIGRGTNCNIHLTDSRVALHHATITKNSVGSFSIEALSTMLIDASAVTIALLKENQQIQLGPYTLVVSKATDDADLAFSIELTTAAESAAAPITKRYAQTLKQTWLSRRALSWLAVGVIAFAFIAAPIYYALHTPSTAAASTNNKVAKTTTLATVTPTDAWNPGPLDSSHANFGRDCRACHQTPFVQVENSACENCHKTIGWHFALDTPAAKNLHESVFDSDTSQGRCASCHRDHKGVDALKRQDSPLCTDCHRDLKTQHETLAIPNITDFTIDHPPFKLSMLVAGKTGKDALVRVLQDKKPALIEKSNLKFPHDIHLSAKGVRSPNAANSSDATDKSSNKEILTCKNCHTPDETGTRFKPISMKEHCQDCHSLAFEPAATTREVPHGNVADVVSTVNEFYAEAALFNKPIDATGRSAPQKNAAWAKQKANAVVTDMMEKQSCFSCHTITKTSSSWVIAPIAITQHWLPKSRFPHAQHNTHECSSCHDAGKSKSATDILIPDIKNCQSCHAGNVPVVDKTIGTCQTCHGFHVGGPGAGTPAVLPQLPKTAPKIFPKSPLASNAGVNASSNVLQKTGVNPAATNSFRHPLHSLGSAK